MKKSDFRRTLFTASATETDLFLPSWQKPAAAQGKKTLSSVCKRRQKPIYRDNLREQFPQRSFLRSYRVIEERGREKRSTKEQQCTGETSSRSCIFRALLQAVSTWT